MKKEIYLLRKNGRAIKAFYNKKKAVDAANDLNKWIEENKGNPEFFIKNYAYYDVEIISVE